MTRNQLQELLPIGDPLGRNILFDPISAIGSGLVGSVISGVGSIIGGITGGSAAAKAGKQISQTGQALDQSASTAALNAQNAVNNAGTNAQQLMSGAANNAIGYVNNATGNANNALQGVFQGQAQNLNPYLQTGTTAAGLLNQAFAPGGSLSTQFSAPTAQQVMQTPGYQFQLQQGQQAAQRLAAASGSLQSGGTAKALDQYSQGLASTYYQNAFNNSLQGYQTNFQNTLNSLNTGINAGLQGSSLYNSAASNYGNQTAANLMNAGLYAGNTTTNSAQYQGNVGLNAAQLAGNYGLQGVQLGGNYLMQGALGSAAATMGQNNAFQNMLGGLTSSIGGGLNAYSLMKGYSPYGNSSQPFSYDPTNNPSIGGGTGVW